MFYDEEGNVITRQESVEIVHQCYTVPEKVRKRMRNITKNKIGERWPLKKRAETKLTRKGPVSSLPENNISQEVEESQEIYAHG